METLFERRGGNVEFVVLFGSMARGDWPRNSGYDVLVGLRADTQPRFIDRLGTFLDLSEDGQVEALPYTLPEVARMFARFNRVILAALRDGLVLFDLGTWRSLQDRFQHLLDEGLLIQEHRGWRWTEEAEARLASSA